MALLEIDNLRVNYGAIEALHGISLKVEAGQIVALLGANGAGKSTTLRAVSGLLRATGGTIHFDGKSLTSMKPHRIVEAGIAHVPEGRGIFAAFTVAENLAIGGYVRKRDATLTGEIDRVLDIFPRLKERYRQAAGTLSGGEQQMLAIGRALLARPRLLLLDEPSLGLAPQVVQLIFRTIRDIRDAGTTILLVEQNVHMALNAADYAYVLEVGAIAAQGPAAELAKSDEIRKAYLGVA